MRILRKAIVAVAALTLLSATMLTSRHGSAQDGTKLAKSFYIQAQAMGQSTQLGLSYGVTLIIEEFSTTEDQKVLLDAFNQKSNEGLVNALSKMKSKGRISITGTLGYDVNYIKKFDMPDGSTKIRLVTDRPIRFGEAWSDSRSMDYSLSGAEIILSPDKKKNSGMLAPACRFKIDKDNALQLELLQNEWKLVSVQQR
jgi:hypothetical protein